MFLAAPATQAGVLYGIVRVADHCPQEKIFMNKVLPGAIIKAKWIDGTNAAESDAKGRYKIVFPYSIEKLVVTLSMDGFSTMVQEIMVQGRNKIRLNWDLTDGCAPTKKSSEILMIDPRSSSTIITVTRQQAETFGRW